MRHLNSFRPSSFVTLQPFFPSLAFLFQAQAFCNKYKARGLVDVIEGLLFLKVTSMWQMDEKKVQWIRIFSWHLTFKIFKLKNAHKRFSHLFASSRSNWGLRWWAPWPWSSLWMPESFQSLVGECLSSISNHRISCRNSAVDKCLKPQCGHRKARNCASKMLLTLK